MTNLRSSGEELSVDAANNAVRSNDEKLYHIVWNVNAAEEQGSGASGDIVIALESLTGDVYGYSSANTTAAGGNPVSVSGSAYGRIPAGTELVLRNRSGRTIALHAAATPNGGGVLPLTNLRSSGEELSVDAANNAVRSNDEKLYHIVWNVNAAEEQGSGASGDIVIALESLTGDVYGYSSANTTAAGGNPVSVSGSAYGRIPAGTELVLRNRSGRTIALHAAATPNGDYAGGITVIKA